MTQKTIKEINEKIRKKEAVVVTAEEIIDIVDKEDLLYIQTFRGKANLNF